MLAGSETGSIGFLSALHSPQNVVIAFELLRSFPRVSLTKDFLLLWGITMPNRRISGSPKRWNFHSAALKSAYCSDIETIFLIAALNSIRKPSLLASFPVTWPKTVYHVACLFFIPLLPDVCGSTRAAEASSIINFNFKLRAASGWIKCCS